MKDTLLTLLILVFLCFISFICGKKYAESDIETEIKHDTIRIEHPIYVKDTITQVRIVKVPIVQDADTIYKEKIVHLQDTVRVAIQVEQREYRDSNYHAIVSGARIGDLRPSLDLIEVFTHTECKSVSNRKRIAFFANLGVAFNGNAQTIGGGVIIKGTYGFDARYLHAENKNYGMIGVSYYFGNK